MRWSICHCVACPLVLLASAALADSGGSTTTYRWVDAQGVVHYSDTPQPGAQRVQIQPAQTFQSLPAPSGARGPLAQPSAVYQSCAIAQPTAEQTFYAPDSLAVNVQLAPDLRPGDQLSVTVDGQAVPASDDSGVNFQVTSPQRGAHTLQAVVRDPHGNTVCNAAPVTIYVERPSLLTPHSPAEGHGVTPAQGH